MPKQATAKAFGKRKRKRESMLANFNKKKKLDSSVSPSTSTSTATTTTSSGTSSSTSTSTTIASVCTTSVVTTGISENKLSCLSIPSPNTAHSNFVGFHDHHHFCSFVESHASCPECSLLSMYVSDEPIYKSGLFCRYKIICKECDHSFNYEPVSESFTREYVLAMRECGINYEQASCFHVVAELATLFTRRSFSIVTDDIFVSCRKEVDEHFQRAARSSDRPTAR